MDRIERKLQRLRRIEASYRADIRRALERSKADTVTRVKAREKFERVRAKYERKFEQILPKIKALTVRRAELKGTGKG